MLKYKVHIYLAMAVDALRSHKKRPNVLFIVGDDIGELKFMKKVIINNNPSIQFVKHSGFGDVSWNNEYALTPNLESLARNGIILNNFYASEICSPSRASLMTGY